MDQRTNPQFELSVVVATRGPRARLASLLARCDQQTLAPRRFQVLVVDDGAAEPVQLDPPAHRFALMLLRQDRAGPAAARNLALDHATGAIVLFLEDDALPAFDLFEKHLAVHAARTDKVAVLGTFGFSPAARALPFVQVLDDSDLLYDTVRLRDGALHPWTYFWTCNLSLPLAVLREAGGFDADAFPEGAFDDLELGLRLAEAGWSVLFRKELACEHDHAFTADEYFERAVRQGLYSARLAKLYGRSPRYQAERGAGLPGDPRSTSDAIARAVALAEGYHAPARDFLDKLRLMELGDKAAPLSQLLIAELRSMTRRLALAPSARGQLIELAGFDPDSVLQRGPARDVLTSVIVTTCDRFTSLRACLERLRATRETAHPIEIVVVDDGSRDGTAEFLAGQADVTTLRNGASLGAPAARNRGLAAAHGEQVVFLDDDALVTPGWLGRLLYHAEVDPGSGCIGPTSDRAEHGQQVALPASTEPDPAATFARRLARESSRQHVRAAVLDSCCLLVSRRVLDAIGGFDERLAPCGREAEDFTLRATLAGFRNRCARDVFVQRALGGERVVAEPEAEALRLNAELFAAKWGLDPASVDAPRDSAAADELRLGPLLARHWSIAELHVPLQSSEHHAAPLPRPSAQDRSTPRS